MSLLSDLLVRFRVVGQEDVDKASASTKKGIEQIGAASDEARKKWELVQAAFASKGLEKLATGNFREGIANLFAAHKAGQEGGQGGVGVGAVATAASACVGLLVAGVQKLVGVMKAGFDSLMGFIQAGIQASSVGDLLAWRWDRLNRIIAGAFGPEIMRIMEWLDKLAIILARVAASKQFEDLMNRVDEAFDYLGDHMGVVETVALRLISTFTALAIAMEKAEKYAKYTPSGALASLLEKWIPKGALSETAIPGKGLGDRDEAPRKSAGFEQIEDVYKRIAKASIGAGLGKGIPEQQLDVAMKQLTALLDLIKATLNIKPAVAN